LKQLGLEAEGGRAAVVGWFLLDLVGFDFVGLVIVKLDAIL
jgi:hypothetical protein